MIEEKGSFRDPAGSIYYLNQKVFRKLSKEGEDRLKFITDNNILNESIKDQYLIKTSILDKNDINHKFKDKLILEHEKIPFISYPYEWSFSQLKSAALHHLNFHLYLLEKGATLIDSSAYNIQFLGSKPIFIDVLSIKKYEEGEFWTGHKQFCENFLNPLVLSSKKGINFNNWFKGNLEGIETSEINKVLSFFDKFSYNIFVQIYLLDKLEKNAKKNKSLSLKKKKNKFPKKNFVLMLNQLKNFITSLKCKKNISLWQDYSDNNSYRTEEENVKKNCVKHFCKNNKFNKFLDIGCNNGLYSNIALENDVDYVVGIDYDLNSIEDAFNQNEKYRSKFLPLYFDGSNPSPNIGWNNLERKSFNNRAMFDGLIALAFEHHLAIAKNIPLKDVIEWIVSLAPKGLIEFVPKNDDTIKKMLEFKGDIFPNYTEENFQKFLQNKSKIVSSTKISNSGRIIYEYER